MHDGNMILAELRASQGISQTQLAEAIGVTQPTISRAERLSPDVTLGIYMRCAEALGVTLADLFAAGRTAEEEWLLRKWRALQEGRDKKRFLGLLQLVLDDEAGIGFEADIAVDPTGT
jgi:transcriptional regulator with XRE-family HTH domain